MMVYKFQFNVFQWKTQTVQFTQIYIKHILFFTWYTYDKHDNDDSIGSFE